MTRIKCLFMPILAIALSSVAANAAQIGLNGFSSNAELTTFDGLGFPTFDNEAPLEIDGHSITTNDGIFRYNTFDQVLPSICVENECVGSNTDLGFIDVALGGSNERAGAWTATTMVGWEIEASFYDMENVLLGSVIIVGTFDPVFVGWENADGIGRIRFQDLTDNDYIMTIDNLIVENVPVPAAIWLFGTALGLIGYSSRKAA